MLYGKLLYGRKIQTNFLKFINNTIMYTLVIETIYPFLSCPQINLALKKLKQRDTVSYVVFCYGF